MSRSSAIDRRSSCCRCCDDGRIVLIRQYRPSVGRRLWELPAGSSIRTSRSRKPRAASAPKRLGLVPATDRTAGRVSIQRRASATSSWSSFESRDCRRSGPIRHTTPDEDEFIETRMCTVAEARTMVARGEIDDLKTAYGLSLA